MNLASLVLGVPWWDVSFDFMFPVAGSSLAPQTQAVEVLAVRVILELGACQQQMPPDPSLLTVFIQYLDNAPSPY